MNRNLTQTGDGKPVIISNMKKHIPSGAGGGRGGSGGGGGAAGVTTAAAASVTLVMRSLGISTWSASCLTCFCSNKITKEIINIIIIIIIIIIITIKLNFVGK